MPIIQINHPENLITRPLDDAAPIPLIGYIEELHKQSAEFRILKPGFNGDITPGCFKNDPLIPPVDFRLKVDKTGEKGVITRTLPADTPAAYLGWIVDVDQIDTDGLIDRPSRTYFPVPASKDKTTYLMAYRVRHSEEETSLYLGGLVAHVALPQAKELKRVFGRPWPRLIDIVKPRTFW